MSDLQSQRQKYYDRILRRRLTSQLHAERMELLGHLEACFRRADLPEEISSRREAIGVMLTPDFAYRVRALQRLENELAGSIGRKSANIERAHYLIGEMLAGRLKMAEAVRELVKYNAHRRQLAPLEARFLAEGLDPVEAREEAFLELANTVGIVIPHGPEYDDLARKARKTLERLGAPKFGS